MIEPLKSSGDTEVELVVLPGLDGTAMLHDDFANAVSPLFKRVHVIAYPPEQPLSYSELESLVRAQLPKEAHFVLLGESFSGPLAITIASAPPTNLVGLVLSTTFAKPPIPFARVISALVRIGPVRALPMVLLSWLLLGEWSTQTLRENLRTALQKVSPRVLRARALASLRVDVTALLPLINVPVLCLFASSDRLLRFGSATDFQLCVPCVTITELAGPHLLLQSVPQQSARVIEAFLARTVGRLI
ncbi:alpha/beta fold hydrolase [Atopomonas hussainii]|nr:alpha/beta hydrolase [Atopomonas hussainii]